MDIRTICTIAMQELRLATRNRWLVSFAVLYTLLAVTILFFASADAGRTGFDGFNRMTASLLNLSLYLVPIIALVIGSTSLAGEREEGSLGLLMTYPVNPWEAILGKYIGLALSLFLVIGLGYGVAALLMSVQGQAGSFDTYLLFVLLTYLLTLMSLSLSLWLGALAKTRMQAFGFSIMAWACLVFLFEFMVMALLFVVNKSLVIPLLVLSIFLNPVNLIRVWIMLLMGGGTLFGASLYELTKWADSTSGMIFFSLGITLWCMIPLLLATLTLLRRGAHG